MRHSEQKIQGSKCVRGFVRVGILSACFFAPVADMNLSSLNSYPNG